MELTKCVVCEVTRPYGGSEECFWTCPFCEERYGPTLIEATVDPFDYALCLRTGQIIRFVSASIHGRFVILSDGGNGNGKGIEGLDPFPCPRGVEIRVDDILWIAKAPQGS